MEQYKEGRDDMSRNKYREVRDKLTKIFHHREVFWRQRAKQLWLEAGDQNSKFFHAYASNRMRNNHTNKLKNDNGGVGQWAF